MPGLAARAESVAASQVREVAELAMHMEEAGSGPVLRLCFGESDLPSPSFLAKALQQGIADGFTKYTSNYGLLSLRREIAAYCARLHGAKRDPERDIVVTASGVHALNVGIRGLVEAGDHVLTLNPAWPNAARIAQLIGAEVSEVEQQVSNGRFTIDFDALRHALRPNTRLLVFTSPSNPTGWTATAEELQGLLQFARQHGLWLMADEVYERLVWNGPPRSILQYATSDDAVVVVQSFSKAWCMTGWRLGWIVTRADHAAVLAKLIEYSVSCPAGFVQRAGEAALREGEPALEQMLAGFRANRAYCADLLRSLPGITLPEPEGAFYCFPRISGLRDSLAWCRDLLQQQHVAVAPGAAFGPGGEGSLRICYAAQRHTLEEAMLRLADFHCTRLS
jgi:aspartate aminotransferase